MKIFDKEIAFDQIYPLDNLLAFALGKEDAKPLANKDTSFQHITCYLHLTNNTKYITVYPPTPNEERVVQIKYISIMVVPDRAKYVNISISKNLIDEYLYECGSFAEMMCLIVDTIEKYWPEIVL